MGLTKQYLLYKHQGNCNIIASGRPNISFVIYNKIEGRYVITGAAENVILWDLRLGQSVFEFKREKQEVTAIRPSPDKLHIAVGYIDGIVEVFDIDKCASVFSLALHKNAINVLRYDKLGINLASGGQDTEIVVSDIISQMGKSRLIGHNAPITDAHFLTNFNDNIAISSSKDTQIKFWHLDTQSCFKTIVDNRTEIWGIALIGDFLISGSAENTMNVYKISAREETVNKDGNFGGLIEGLSLDDDDIVSPIKVINCGNIPRAAKGRIISIVSDSTGRVLSCHGTNNLIENFYFCTKKEASLRLDKRLKKTPANELTDASKEICIVDEIKRLPTIKNNEKIKSIDIVLGSTNELRVVINCSNNMLQLYSLDIKHKNTEPKLLRTISQCGHQSEVRSITFTSDSLAFVSGSGESLKFWNRESFQCLRTVECDYVLSTCFAPGNRYVVAGMKSGRVVIVDILIGEILEEIEAHEKEVWSICLLPDLKGCVTGSGDMTVKTWLFKLIDQPRDDNEKKLKILSLLHKSTLKLEEAVLCVKISPNSKFVLIGLLDSTVKIFFLDSYKFYLSLYGHRLPILCMDVSYDSAIIATGSADRNVKIWGMDFGDCHKSLFAHDDSVMSLQFIPDTHMFFTCGKDGKVKQWDADNFQKIITLPGHIGEAYTVAISPNGRYIASCGSDRTIRVYERTDEPIVLQDVQEEEREEIENRTLATGEDTGIPILPGLKLPSKKTIGSEKSAESILECLDIIKGFDAEEIPTIHPLMQAYDAKTSTDFLVIVLQRIRSSDLEEALVLLPFSYVCQIIEKLPHTLRCRKDQTELLCKVSMFLFKIHQKPILTNQNLLIVIIDLLKELNASITELRDMIGCNLHAFQLLQRNVEANENIELFKDASRARKQRDKKFKKRELAKRLHIQMS